jgi:hypothetical protein
LTQTWRRGALALAALVASGGVALARAAGWLEAPFDRRRLVLDPAPPREPPAGVTSLAALYSGHSLSEGVAEHVQALAQSVGQEFRYEQQLLVGSLIRQRVRGENPQSVEFAGFKSGRNRTGVGLDVEAALRGTLPPPERAARGLPERFDALVVTERHDLPYAVAAEGTVQNLREIHDRLIEGNPQARSFFYQSWLEIDPVHPERFVDYERKAVVLWECVASAVNRGLAQAGRSDRVQVLPGGVALAALVERLAQGNLEGLPVLTPLQRLKLVFRDNVHLTDTGQYFMGAVHYATLFGRSPEGGALPPEVSPPLGRELQRLAWEQAQSYTAEAEMRAARPRELCSDYARSVLCPLFNQHVHHGGSQPLVALRRTLRCRSAFGSAAEILP